MDDVIDNRGLKLLSRLASIPTYSDEDIELEESLQGRSAMNALNEAILEARLCRGRSGDFWNEKVVWQPKLQVFPDDLASFEVFETLEAGLRTYPDIPESNWEPIPASAVENPVIIK